MSQPRSPWRRRLPPLALALSFSLGLLCAGGAKALPSEPEKAGFRFQIVTADESSVTRRIAEDLYKRLVPIFGGFRTELAQKRRLVYVTIGPVALRNTAARKCDCVVIAAYTSSQVWRSITAELPVARRANMTAIYAEPSPVDQLKLVSLLYKRPVRVAAIVSGETGFLKPLLDGSNAVEIEDYAAGADINYALNRVGQAQVLLAMPDRTVYSAENFRNILLSTYRHKQGVIGFSADMVKVGALATTYSEVEDINTQVAEMVAGYVAGGELPPAQFPRYFHTIVNEGVARSLDVEVPDTARNFARPAPRHRP